MYDLAVIGAGPAGMTAALYALRAGKSVIMFENEGIGGQIALSPKVENFPSIKEISGNEFSANLYSQADSFGVVTEFSKVLTIDDKGDYKTVVTETGEFNSKAVIIATGQKHKTLGIERENELSGFGISYCAVCDGAFFKNKDVAVVGGGNTALQDAIFLSDICNSVTLIHRRDEFRADKALVEKLKTKNNIKLMLNSQLKELIGEKELDSIRVNEETINVSALFVCVGQIPNNQIFKNLLKLDENGYIITNENLLTSIPGIYAAGDCRKKSLRQLVTAVSDGALAAINSIS